MNQIHFLRAIALGGALSLPAISHAQPALDKMPIVDAANVTDLTPDRQTARIKVRNTPSALLAYWLDPNHQPTPMQIQLSEANAGSQSSELDLIPRQPGNGNGPRDLKLPEGIESIFSVDPQNVLIVEGTAAGIEALRTLVKELDVPLSQVEVEAQFCQMSPQTLKALPLKFAKNSDSSYAPSVALVPPTISWSAELIKLTKPASSRRRA